MFATFLIYTMSRIVKVLDSEILGGDVMPWGNLILEIGGDKILVCAGVTGRGFNMKQEYPEMIEQEDFDTAKQASIVTCPHTIEEQVEIILEKYDKNFKEAGTSFENVFYVDYYFTQRYNFPRAFRAMRKWFAKRYPNLWWYTDKPPYHRITGTLAIVQGLDHPDMLIEIKMWAAIPNKNGETFESLNDKVKQLSEKVAKLESQRGS
jgi:enamine deaminase RidA (YjgF/YER057c/UK114 family)